MMVIDLSEDTVNAREKIAPLPMAQIKSEAEEIKTQQSRDGFRPPLDHWVDPKDAAGPPPCP